jgi:hypothetical protein
MQRDALVAQEQLDVGSGQADFDLLAKVLARHAVVLAADVEVVVPATWRIR